MTLFISDFDGTIALGNTHNALCNITDGNIDVITEIILQFPPVGSAVKQREVYRNILKNHELAIASFNAFGNIAIPIYLEKVIGLTPDEIEKIHIESWQPMSRKADKNEHIAGILKDKKYQGALSSVVLIDDDPDNIRAAQNKGYTTIHATDSGKHFTEITQLTTKWCDWMLSSLSRFFSISAKPGPVVVEPALSSSPDTIANKC